MFNVQFPSAGHFFELPLDVKLNGLAWPGLVARGFADC